MKKLLSIRTHGLSIMLLLSSVSATAQTVEELCKKNVSCLGGKDAIENVQTVKITQMGTAGKADMTMTTILLPGKAYYQKTRSSYGTMITCAMQGQGWVYNSVPVGKTTDLPLNMAQSMVINSKFYGPLYDYYINGQNSDVTSITSMGMSTIDREECHKLKIVYKSGYAITVYLSTADYMIKKSESPLGSVKYGDYRKVKNVMIPYYTETSNMQGTIVAIVSKAQINVKVKNEIFNRP